MRPAAHSTKAAVAQADGSRQVTVTLLGSVHGQLRHIAASVRGLGLRRRHQSVVVADTAANRGMIHTAWHLLKVESK